MNHTTPWLERLDRIAARLALLPVDHDPPATLTQALLDALNIESAELWLSDATTRELRLRTATYTGDEQPQPDAVPLSDKQSPLVRAIQHREPLIMVIRAAHGQASPEHLAAVPLLTADAPLGVLLLRRPAPFPLDAPAALRVLAHQIALTLEHARVVTKAEAAREASARQLDRLTALTRITHQLLAADELDTVVRVVVESASRLCDVSGALVQLIDDDRENLVVLAAHGEPSAFFEQFHSSRLTDAFYANTVAGHSLARRRPVVVEDYAAWSTPYEMKPTALTLGVRAIVAAPMLLDGAPIGLLWVCDLTPRPFTAEDVALVEALADQAALAIQHTRLRARDEEAAVLEERARLARDLHDSVTQSVFSLHLMTNAAHAQHERGAPDTAATLTARLHELPADLTTIERALGWA